jgi:DNA-directed RNA polymerase subunit RPC12/RpoP
MQIEEKESVCPACGAARLEFFPMLHHMVCAHVGPQYDFLPAATGYACPKCRRDIVSGDPACKIVRTNARCARCRKEMIVSPSAVSHEASIDKGHDLV